MPDFREFRSPAVSGTLARLAKTRKRLPEDFEAGLARLREANTWLGDVVSGYHPTVRKVRLGIPSQRLRPSAGLRLVYRTIPEVGLALLISILVYYKKEQPNFTDDEFRKALKAVRPKVEPALVAAGLSKDRIEELLTP